MTLPPPMTEPAEPMLLRDVAATRALGMALARHVRPGDHIVLSGGLGAGKTTLVRGLIEGLGHAGEVPSPSFTLVQPYEHLVPPVWHADLYRLQSPDDVDELGFETIADGVLVVEWPEEGPAWLREGALWLTLTLAEDGARRLTAQVPPSWEARWPLR